MKAKYLITVETNNGEDAPTIDSVRTAIYWSGTHYDCIRGVDVTMVKDDITLGNDLYAYGWKDGGRWVLLDYFNTHTKAANAVKRARVNSLRAFKKDVDFAAFKFNPRSSEWERC